MTDPCIKYSIVIPVYRSGAWLGELAARIMSVLAAHSEAFELLPHTYN